MEDGVMIFQNSFDPNFVANVGSQITRDILVIAIEPSNAPISDATVKAGKQTATTDSIGIAIITQAEVFTRFGYITIEKAGFIRASRSIALTQGTNIITIMMLPETVSGTTASEEKLL